MQSKTPAVSGLITADFIGWVRESDSKKHGLGACKFSNGDVYVGEYRDGRYHGRGKYTRPDGAVYEGGWKDGEENGSGKSIFKPSGNTYEGEWKNGQMNGRGTFVYATGGRYVGCYIDGKRDGMGVYYSRDGNYFDGEWKDGMMNGYGTMWHTRPTPLYPTGRADSGMWRDGDFLGR